MMKKTGWKDRSKAVWMEWRGFLLIVMVMFSFRSALADWNDVPTGSMKPSILIGDRVFVNKLAYDLKVPFTTKHIATWDNPERGDVAVFYSPEDKTRLVKRVVGLPGDRISMINNHLFINGQPATYQVMDESYREKLDEAFQSVELYTETIGALTHPVMFNPSRPSMTSFPTITVPQGHYFMMGDNRDNSNDSRFFGTVPRQKILGRATSVVFSLDYENFFLPRGNRFFHGME